MVDLARIVHGVPTERPPLVIVHGLFGSGRNWGAIARRLSEGAEARQVVAVDMRNHGDSPADPVHDYEALAGDLAGVLAEVAPDGRVDLLGHSMGGKAAMVLALTRPERLRRLVVADMAPAAYAHSQMRYVEAMAAVDLSTVRRRGDADAALAASVPDRGLRAFLLQSLALSSEGARWKLNLAALADQMPRIMDFPDVGQPFAGPALFVTGAESTYVRPENEARIRDLFPAARLQAIAGAGHWLHADAPEAFTAAVAAFLDAG